MNNVSGTLSEADIAAVLAAIQTIREKLPFLIDLTPEQRHELPKMGDKSVAFVNAALTLVEQNPDVVPGAFDLAEFKRDVALLANLAPIVQAVSQLKEKLDGTVMGAGTDAYVASLLIYQSAKIAGKDAGLNSVLDGMGQRFAHKSKPKIAAKPTT